MKFVVLTLFPEMVEAPLSRSVLGRARAKNLIELTVLQIRDFCLDKHRQVDDAPFGGGGGMVIKAEPVLRAVEAAKIAHPGLKVVHLSPQGRRLDHAKVLECATARGFILLCGHYEGIDQRALDAVVEEEISIGDYVLTGGELAACVFIDAVARQIPGVLGDESSAANDSFCRGLLDFPHYTRPASLPQGNVPEVLLSGDHQAIESWRRRAALLATLRKRPDLLEKAELTREEKEFIQNQRGPS